MGALALLLLAAGVFTLSIYTLASNPTGDLTPWQAVATAWSVVGIMGSIFMLAGGVMLAIWGLVE